MTKKTFIEELKNLKMTQAGFCELVGKNKRGLSVFSLDDELPLWYEKVLNLLITTIKQEQEIAILKEIIKTNLTGCKPTKGLFSLSVLNQA